MKTKCTMILLAASLAFATPAFSQGGNKGRCGQPRGTCEKECQDGSCLRQGQGNGNGQGQGFRRGKKDGTGQVEGQQDRQRRRDGSGGGRGRGT